MKRRLFELRWDKRACRWRLYEEPSGRVLDGFANKTIAIRACADIVRRFAPSELVFKTKAGRIGKGSSGRRTYGGEPNRWLG